MKNSAFKRAKTPGTNTSVGKSIEMKHILKRGGKISAPHTLLPKAPLPYLRSGRGRRGLCRSCVKPHGGSRYNILWGRREKQFMGVGVEILEGVSSIDRII